MLVVAECDESLGAMERRRYLGKAAVAQNAMFQGSYIPEVSE